MPTTSDDDPGPTSVPGPDSARDPAGRPMQVTVAAVIAAVESIGVLVYAVIVAAAAIRTPGTVSAWPAEVLIYLVFAGGLAVVARGLANRRGFSRSPFVVAQMFGIIVGWTLLSGTEWVRVTGMVILAMAGLGLAAGFSPALRDHLTE